ncbi:glycosyltransferase [Hydrogenophaga sp. RWCD_12]|uniref:glycosyltransferase n=1 Tax=Hydrogenophaga sp. RWCD_12 TaxID=3391190 RepID=UPI00398489F9
MSTTVPFYRAFEDRYRGSRDVIKARLAIYLDFLRPLIGQGVGVPKAVDLGCGRGEWLELLVESGFDATGIDLDEGMLAASRERGLAVVRGDALAHLSSLPDNSQAVVSAFHLVEHLPFDAVQTLISQSLRVLRPGGLLILETPNSENLVVGTSHFYLDPTHQKPIPHQLLGFLAEYHGFVRNKILRLQEAEATAISPSPTLWEVLVGASPDYAVVAQKGGAEEDLARFNDAFGREYGLSLEALAHRHEVHVRGLGEQMQRGLHALDAELTQTGEVLRQAARKVQQLTASVEQLNAEVERLQSELSSQREASSRGVEDLSSQLQQSREMVESLSHQLAAWRAGTDASMANAVERLNRLERSGLSAWIKYGLVRPVVGASLALGAAVLAPFPGVRQRSGQWLASRVPGLHRRLALLRNGGVEQSAQPAVAEVVMPVPEVPRGAFKRAAAVAPAVLLADPSLSTMARPVDLESCLSPISVKREHESLETVTTLGQMRRSATSLAFVLTIHDGDRAALTRSVQSVLRQTDPAWELLLCAPAELQPLVDEWLDIDWRIRRVTGTSDDEVQNLLKASAQCTTAFMGLLTQGDGVDDDLVKHLSQALAADPGLDLVYSDEATLLDDGSVVSPFFKPDWSPEHHHSVNLLGRFLAVRKALLLNLAVPGSGSPEADEYALSLAVSAKARRFAHLEDLLYVRRRESDVPAGGFFSPEALEPARTVLQAHLSATDPGVQVMAHASPGCLQVRWPIPEGLEVTLLILTNMQERELPGRGKLVLATNFVESIIAKSTYPGYKIIVVDDGHVPDDLRDLLARHGHSTATFVKDGDFSFAAKSNFATSLVKSGVALLLNDDLEVIAPDWIEALVSHAARPDVGVVGGKLLFPNNRIQHAGISTGLNGSAGHVFMNSPADALEYGGYASVDRNYGAVTGAVMAYRKEFFDRMGGFDEFFRVDYNDIDFCLRCVRDGYRVVYTPHALLYHFHNSSFKRKHDKSAERQEFLSRWQHLVERDPYCGLHLRTISAEQAHAEVTA